VQLLHLLEAPSSRLNSSLLPHRFAEETQFALRGISFLGLVRRTSLHHTLVQHRWSAGYCAQVLSLPCWYALQLRRDQWPLQRSGLQPSRWDELEKACCKAEDWNVGNVRLTAILKCVVKDWGSAAPAENPSPSTDKHITWFPRNSHSRKVVYLSRVYFSFMVPLP